MAAEQHTDFVELDVQESADGQVLVVHDSDLMKVGSDATKIWEGDAAQLRAVDIGSYSYRGPQFSAELLVVALRATVVFVVYAPRRIAARDAE